MSSVFANNVLISINLLTVAAYYLHFRLWGGEPRQPIETYYHQGHMIQWGIILMAAGSLLRVGWWVPATYIEVLTGTYPSYAVALREPVYALSSVLVCWGGALHLYPIIVNYFGRLRWLCVAFGNAAVYCLAYLLVT